MIIAGDGTLLMIGLSRQELVMLLCHQPIRVNRELHGHFVPEGFRIILGYEDTDEALRAIWERAGILEPAEPTEAAKPPDEPPKKSRFKKVFSAD